MSSPQQSQSISQNNQSIDLSTCRCNFPSIDKINSLYQLSKNQTESFNSEVVNTTHGARTFRILEGEQKLQELTTSPTGESTWRNHNQETIKPFYFSEGKLYNNQGKQIGELFLNPEHIDLQDKLIKGVGVVRIEGKDFQFNGKDLSLVTEVNGKRDWGVVIVGLPPSTKLTTESISERLLSSLSEVVDYKLDALEQGLKKLTAEMKIDLVGNKLDQKKVDLLLAYACMATETFDPKSEKHQELIKTTISDLRDLVQKSSQVSNFQPSTEITTKLKAIEGMFNVLCVDKENVIAEFVNSNRLSKDSPIALFRDKIVEYKNKSQDELKSLAHQALIEIKSEVDPDKRANAYLTLSALYYTQKNDPGFKEQLKEGLIEFAKVGFKSEKEAISGSIFMAHTSWDKLTPEQLNVIYTSPIKDFTLPFASILTNVVTEGDPNAVSSKTSWQEYFAKHPPSQNQNASDVTKEVLNTRLRLLDVKP